MSVCVLVPAIVFFFVRFPTPSPTQRERVDLRGKYTSTSRSTPILHSTTAGSKGIIYHNERRSSFPPLPTCSSRELEIHIPPACTPPSASFLTFFCFLVSSLSPLLRLTKSINRYKESINDSCRPSRSIKGGADPGCSRITISRATAHRDVGRRRRKKKGGPRHEQREISTHE